MSDLDYTSVSRVKTEMASTVTANDPLIALVITAASRAIDRRVTGTVDGSGINYFRLDTISNELLWGSVDSHGTLTTIPRKPTVSAVSAMQYRLNPTKSWNVIDPSLLVVDGGLVVKAYANITPLGRVQVMISYTGGYSTTTDNLPADIIEVATILSIRYLREAQTGMADQMGVAELVGSNLFYTKAWPQRALDLMIPYMRRMSWRGVQ